MSESGEAVFKFKIFSKLKVLIISGNPFIEKFSGDWFSQIIHNYKKIRRLNKKLILENEREKVKLYIRDQTIQALKEKKNNEAKENQEQV